MQQTAYGIVRLLILTMSASLILLLAVVYLVSPDPTVNNQTLFTVAVVAALALPLAAVFLQRTRLKALPAGLNLEEAKELAIQRWRAGVFASMAVTEAAALVGLVLAFSDGSFLLYLPGLSTALIAIYGWVLPRPATVEAARERLEANGTRTQLWEALNGLV